MDWFRFYDGVLDDAKVQQLPDRLFKVWINLLCLANRGSPRGTLPGSLEVIAFSLRMPVAALDKALADLEARGLFDLPDGVRIPHNWSGRQYESDDVNARSRTFRERQQLSNKKDATLHATLHGTEGNVAATLYATPPDTDTESDTESEIYLPSTSLVNPPREPVSAGANALAHGVRTAPKPTSQRIRTDPAFAQAFNVFWSLYPLRSGAKAGSRREAQIAFGEIPEGRWPEVIQATRNYAGLDRIPKDAHRFLSGDFWESFIDVQSVEQREQGNANKAAARRSATWDAHVSAIAASRDSRNEPAEDPRADVPRATGPAECGVVPFRGRVG